MKDKRTGRTVSEPKIEVIRFSDGDVLTASGPDELTHGYDNELQNCGLGGFFNIINWYTKGDKG